MHKSNNRIAIRLICCHYSVLLVAVLVSLGNLAEAQTVSGAHVFHFTSSYTCFPESKRLNGYTYDSVFYDFAGHYNDSSVVLVIPDKFKETSNTVDIVFWFHG